MNDEEILAASEEFNKNSYKIKMFRSIPEGNRLVLVNKFTGKITAKGPGCHFIWPWIYSKKVSSESQPLSTPETSTIASDDIRIYYDTDYHFKIVDPVKYTVLEQSLSSAIEETTLEKMIGSELDQLVANYVKKQSSDIFKSNSNLDIRGQIENDLVELEKKYGVEVTKIILTNVQLPKEITNQAEKNRVDQLRRPNDLANAENEQKVVEAKAKAKATEIETLANANKANLDNYVNAGVPGDQIGKIISSDKLVNGNNPNTFVIADMSNGNSNLGNNVAYMEAMRQMMLNNPQSTGNNLQSTGNNLQSTGHNQLQQKNDSSFNSVNDDSWMLEAEMKGFKKGTEGWWSFAPDDQYLTPEDSILAWKEIGRNETLPPGARVHMIYLTPQLLEKYPVAANKFKQK